MFKEGHQIRVALADSGLTQVWLINALRGRGVVTEKTEMSSVLSGTRHGRKADKILQISTEILGEYRNGRREEDE